MSNNIKLTAINVRPYGVFDFYAHQYSSSSLIDERHDFVFDEDMTKIAVLIRTENTMFDRHNYIPRRRSFIVSVCDGDEILSSETFSMKLERWNPFDTPRIDIPVGHLSFATGHFYNVRVTARNSKRVLVDCPLRFFPAGTSAYEFADVTKCYILADGKSLRNVCHHDYDDLSVCFDLELGPSAPKHLPEMLVSIYDREGGCETLEGNIEPAGVTDQGNRRIRVSVPLEVDFKLNGPVYADLRILGDQVAGMVFSTDSKDQPGYYGPDEFVMTCTYTPRDGEQLVAERLKMESDQEKDEMLASLDSMVGLRNVKTKIREYVDIIRFNNLRRDAGLPCSMPPLHAIFTGSPGTGKTTIAKIMGKLLKQIGALSKGHVVVRERSTLLGQNYSAESENTLKAIEEARGGILFIDEAYQLHQPNDPRDPGKFVIETLLTALSDEDNRDWMLIMAGYTEPMMKMFGMNPGLASRIPPTNIYTFDDYSPEELHEIAVRYFDVNRYRLSSGAAEALKQLIDIDFSRRESNFGNARYVMNIIHTGIIPAMARRISSVESPSAEMLSAIETVDIPRPAKTVVDTRRRIGFETRRVLA